MPFGLAELTNAVSEQLNQRSSSTNASIRSRSVSLNKSDQPNSAGRINMEQRKKPDQGTLNAETGESSDPHHPENVYKNLIIIEHALRSQFMELQRSRRRGLLFFWGVLFGAVLLTYRVRCDPSIYKLVRLVEQLLMIAFYIATGLFFLTGMYTKVFVVAPRFLADTNRGLKSLNFRLVKIPSSFKEKIVTTLINPVYSEDPAGPVKLILSSREFPPQYIEDWEVFRDEYWHRQRRRRRRLKNRKKEKKQEH